jgi:large subunit ribosomal protein L5e
VHEAIREDPAVQPKQRSKPADAKRWKEVKLTYDQRKDKLKAKLAELVADDE